MIIVWIIQETTTSLTCVLEVFKGFFVFSHDHECLSLLYMKNFFSQINLFMFVEQHTSEDLISVCVFVVKYGLGGVMKPKRVFSFNGMSANVLFLFYRSHSPTIFIYLLNNASFNVNKFSHQPLFILSLDVNKTKQKTAACYRETATKRKLLCPEEKSQLHLWLLESADTGDSFHKNVS